MILVGEDFVTLRQVRPAAIDEVDHRQPVLEGNVLRADVLFDRLAEEGPSLRRGVVRNDHAYGALDYADAGHEARRRDLVVVEPVAGERRQLQEGAQGVHEEVDTVPSQDFTARAMAVDHTRATTGNRPGIALMKGIEDRAIRVRTARKLL